VGLTGVKGKSFRVKWLSVRVFAAGPSSFSSKMGGVVYLHHVSMESAVVHALEHLMHVSARE
jgi:hypothetical protein